MKINGEDTDRYCEQNLCGSTDPCMTTRVVHSLKHVFFSVSSEGTFVPRVDKLLPLEQSGHHRTKHYVCADFDGGS